MKKNPRPKKRPKKQYAKETEWDEAYCMWYLCPHCKQSKIIPGSKFCPNCGKRIYIKDCE